MLCMKQVQSILLRVVCSALLLLIVITIGHTTTLQAQEYKTYLLLGDSITAGYSLEGYQKGVLPKDAYANLVAGELGADIINDAISGQTSEQFYDRLTSGSWDEDLAKADLITLSIGSNDLLIPCINLIKDAFKEDIHDNFEKDMMEAIEEKYNPTTQEGLALLVEKWNQIRSGIVGNDTFQENCDIFVERFPKIVAALKEKAPQAKLVVLGIYHPYSGFELNFPGVINFDLESICTPYIQSLNRAFSDDSKDYQPVSLYQAFFDYPCTFSNFMIGNPELMSFDPHPNVYGHEVIAQKVLYQLEPDRLWDSVSVKQQTIKAGKTKKLKIKSPHGDKYHWSAYDSMEIVSISCTDSSIVSVSKNLKLKAKKTGTAKIYLKVRAEGLEKTIMSKIKVVKSL